MSMSLYICSCDINLIFQEYSPICKAAVQDKTYAYALLSYKAHIQQNNIYIK